MKNTTQNRFFALLAILAFVGQLLSVAAMGFSGAPAETQPEKPACHSAAMSEHSDVGDSKKNTAESCCEGNCSAMLCHVPGAIPSSLPLLPFNAHTVLIVQPSPSLTSHYTSALYRPPIAA